MRRLFLFLFKYRAFLFFLLAEILCGWLIVRNNTYQNAAFFNSANALAANILNVSNEIKGYFSLRSQNEKLSQEMAQLRKDLEFLKNQQNRLSGNKNDLTDLDSNFYFIPARVINNSTQNQKNYFTIDKGANHKIIPGMGVIGGGGIAGKVKYVSNKFAVVISLLHTDLLISSKVLNKVELGSVQWDGRNAGFANLLFIPKHINLVPGDTVYTSGYGGIFPENIKIGVIQEVDSRQEAIFLDVKMKLINDFSKLNYVHIIMNNSKQELDSLRLNVNR